MNEIVIDNYQFRIKTMNMIEVLAFRSQLTFEDVDSTMKLYNQILERIEVQIGDKWLPVKQKLQNIYYPAGIENDFEMIETLVGHFLGYIKSVFQKSNE